MAYTSLMDMFDGGGAGRSGATFQGGGLLSALANRFAKPIGSQRRSSENLSNMINQLHSGGMSNKSIPNIIDMTGEVTDLSGVGIPEKINVSELDDISFKEFSELALPVFEEKGVTPSYDDLLRAYVNYLNRP
jgi:hypothetical protein